MQKRRFAQALALSGMWPAWPVWPALAAEARQPPALLLAQTAPARIEAPERYLVSEKLDGVRAYWTGQRMLSRSGLTMALPDWFSARLPARPLDGELWMGRGRFDAVSAALRRREPREREWREVRYMLFELPDGAGGFEQRDQVLQQIATQTAWEGLQAVAQFRVSSQAELQRRLAEVLAQGGEGLMLHRADAPYRSGRSELLLKLKPHDDAEARVLAHLPGRGKYAGLLGGLRVRNEAGQEFVLGSGFSDAQRRAPPAVGSLISYRFRGLTSQGLPRFASFVREIVE
jgi:DNA ligase 1